MLQGRRREEERCSTSKGMAHTKLDTTFHTQQVIKQVRTNEKSSYGEEVISTKADQDQGS